MSSVRSVLLGSAAGLCAVAGVQAADLPVKKAAPVEYVRVCTAFGAGFFYIPGTDTCLRVGGRARFEYSYGQQRSRGVYSQTTFAPVSNSNADVSGFRGQGRLNLDARTQTAYGTLRAFVRLEIGNLSGANTFAPARLSDKRSPSRIGRRHIRPRTNLRYPDKAFIQFAGITAGRAQLVLRLLRARPRASSKTAGSDVSIALTSSLTRLPWGWPLCNSLDGRPDRSPRNQCLTRAACLA